MHVLQMLMEFEILWKTNLPDAFQLGFLKLTSVITKYGDEAEVIKLSEELTGLCKSFAHIGCPKRL